MSSLLQLLEYTIPPRARASQKNPDHLLAQVAFDLLQLLEKVDNFWKKLTTFGKSRQLFATFGNYLQLLENVGKCWRLLQLLANVANFR